IFDMTGKLVFEQGNFVANTPFAIGQILANGMYTAEVKQGDFVKMVKITKVD
ncbi:MAG: T9SS type A sorting domain-containing protein, partial [Bacteroidia bacterium]